MKTHPSFLRRAAAWLLRHAGRVLPGHRSHWAQAMAAEFEHIPSEAEALRWAFGCVLASYSERIRTLIDVSPPVSRWILGVEMLFCFTPLSLCFLAILANWNRLAGLDPMIYLSVALLGPVGTVIAFKTIALNRPALPKAASWILFMLATWTLFAYPLHLLAQSGGHALDWWREFVLIALLPALAAAHLLYLARASKVTRPSTAD